MEEEEGDGPPPHAAQRVTNSARVASGASRLKRSPFGMNQPGMIRPSRLKTASHAARGSVPVGGTKFPGSAGGTRALPEVDTVSLKAASLAPSRVIEVGVTAQVESDGVPEQLRSTVWANPDCGERTRS